MGKGKTIKQIADELQVDKQKIYRYIKKNHINEVHQINGVMYYDDVAISIITNHFFKNDHINEAHHDVHHEAHHEAQNDAQLYVVITDLMEQIKAQQKTIDNLTEALKQSQTLHAETKGILPKLETALLESKDEKISRLARLKQFIKGV